jgi:hypothetical protein
MLSGGGTMPEFTTVSVQEATLQTSSGRQKRYLHQYIDYITQLPQGQAGRLTTGEEEKHTTIRRRLGVAAKILGIPVIIKRSGTDVYFWREDGGEEPSGRRGRRPRRGRAGDLLLPNQSFSNPPRVEPGVIEEESPELGQLASEAERRVAQG